jgi:hypothetical protein
MRSSVSQNNRAKRRPPRSSTSLKALAAEKPNEPVQVISVNGRVHNHIGSQSTKKLMDEDPYRYTTISALHQSDAPDVKVECDMCGLYFKRNVLPIHIKGCF